MPKLELRLLALLTVFSVAPVAAGHCDRGRCIGAARSKLHHHSTCPFERAREAALASARVSGAARAPTTITLTDRAPADGSLMGLDGGPGFLTP